MRTIELNGTGVEVSALCLGAMNFGSRDDRQTSYEMLDMYYEAGGRYIDTANAYARWFEGCQGGESESLLGEWMRERGNRDELFIASKVGFPAPIDELEQGLSAEQINRAIDGTLSRLGINRVDLYYSHVDDRTVTLEETLGAFHGTVIAGKVRYLGASNYRIWRLERARCWAEAQGWTPYVCMQQRYTYVRPRPNYSFFPHVAADQMMLDYSKNAGITLMAYSPLEGGAYTRSDREFPDPYRWPDTERRLVALREVAAETGATVHQVVLAWMIQGDPPVIPIIAASNEAQMEENLGALDVDLSEAQMARLNEAGF
jgi:aryl-alcohol dehydrogenase-like predicted oxidoreductase